MDQVPNSGRGRAMLLKMGQDAKKITLGQEVPPSSYMVAPCFPMAGRGRAQLIGLAKAANENRPGSGLSSGISSMSSSSPLTISSQSPTGSTPSPIGSTPSPTGSTPSPPGSSTSPTSSGIVPSMGGGGRGMALGLIKAGGLGGPGLASKGRGVLLNMSRAESVVSTISDTKTVTNEPSTSVESITTSLKSATIYSQGKDTLATTAQSSGTDTTVKYHGTSGESVSATANYISMGITPGSAAYEYDVKYDPAQDAKPFRIKMLKHHVPMLGPNTFDGCHLFLPKKLDSKVTELVSPHPVTGTPVNLQLIFKKARQFKDMIQLYNVLFKRIMSALKLVEFKRQYFDPKSAIMIPQYKLEIWPGYVTAVDEYEGGLMLMIDPSHRVLRKQSVLELVRDVIASNRRGGGWQNELKAQLIGQTVMTTYNNKCYIIDDVDFSQTPLSKFEGKDGQVSFMEYYKTNYGIEITDMNQPLLINRKTKRDNVHDQPQDFLIALIPELCNLTGISEAMRTDFYLMKEMAKYTRITPNQRFYAIKKYIENVNANPVCKQMLNDWGLSIRAETVNLNARTLQPEQIVFGDKKVNGSLMADWSRDATNSKAILPIDINNWALLHVRKDEPCSKAFVETLMRCGPPMGIRVSQPQFVCLQSDKPEAYSMALKSVISGSVQIVVCISPTARDDRYTAIKKTCCVENPIPSQVINSRTLMNRDKLRAVVQKVALQMNCKLGGTLWALNMPFKNTMVVGIDVYHGAGKDSCVGFVASYNAALTKWHSSAIIVDKGQEVLDGLKSSFIQSLNFYYNANGQYPSRIIIYRDGVGDGQLPVCTNFEVPQLETCFSLIDPNYNPPLTFVVVQKRINTRIFADLKNQQLENPNPGTVVDNTVTRKGMYDFFLVSQKVRQGTVTPTHYIVVHDSSGISPDHVQRFTYKMCHLYYNWPGTVRVPAPCQYAHKLAFLMGQVVRRPHHNSLSDKLFFL